MRVVVESGRVEGGPPYAPDHVGRGGGRSRRHGGVHRAGTAALGAIGPGRRPWQRGRWRVHQRQLVGSAVQLLDVGRRDRRLGVGPPLGRLGGTPVPRAPRVPRVRHFPGTTGRRRTGGVRRGGSTGTVRAVSDAVPRAARIRPGRVHLVADRGRGAVGGTGLQPVGRPVPGTGHRSVPPAPAARRSPLRR